MKDTRMNTNVMQAVVWFVLNNSPEIDTDILAYKDEFPNDVETSFPPWFNHKIREKSVTKDGCSEELLSLACGPSSSACTYPACIVNGVKFLVHERDILHTTQSSGVSTPGLKEEMYYGQLEEILELTYIGNRKKVKRGYCEDLIETWGKGHSKNGKFTNEENETRYHEMKALQDQSKAGLIPILTNKEILDRIVPSNNRANMSGRGRKLPGGGSTSRRSANPTFGSDVMTRDQITQLLRQEQQEKELYKKQAEEAQQRAYLAALKADAAAARAEAAHSSIGNFQSLLGQCFTHYNRPNSGPFNASFPQTNLVPVPGAGPALAPNWAYYLQPPIPYSQPLQPLRRPYVSPTPIPAPTTSIPVTNNTFNNCYRPFVNSNWCPGSSSNSQIPENDLNDNYLLMNPHMSQNPQHDLNTRNFENEEEDQELAEESAEESAEEEVEVEDEE